MISNIFWFQKFHWDPSFIHLLVTATHSGRELGRIWPQSQIINCHPQMDLFHLKHFKLSFQQLLFCLERQKIVFRTIWGSKTQFSKVVRSEPRRFTLYKGNLGRLEQNLLEISSQICSEILRFRCLRRWKRGEMSIFDSFTWIMSLHPTFEKLSSFLDGRGDPNPFKISLVSIGVDWFESNFSWSYASEQTRDLMPSAGARARSRPLLSYHRDIWSIFEMLAQF